MSGETSGEDKRANAPETAAPGAAEKKTVKQNKGGKGHDGFKPGVWFKEVMAEFGKIIWPNKKELAKMTLTVIVTSLLFGAVIAGLDAFFGFSFGFLTDLV